jgi:hypothetical protein
MSKRFWPAGPAMWLISRRSQGVEVAPLAVDKAVWLAIRPDGKDFILALH